MIHCAAFVVAADAACLEGHFPGAPIVPGVVLLDYVVDAAKHWLGLHITGIARCKFVAALYPEQRCAIALAPPADSRLAFRCTGPDGVLAAGALRCAKPDADRG